MVNRVRKKEKKSSNIQAKKEKERNLKHHGQWLRCRSIKHKVQVPIPSSFLHFLPSFLLSFISSFLHLTFYPFFLLLFYLCLSFLPLFILPNFFLSLSTPPPPPPILFTWFSASPFCSFLHCFLHFPPPQEYITANYSLNCAHMNLRSEI